MQTSLRNADRPSALQNRRLLTWIIGFTALAVVGIVFGKGYQLFQATMVLSYAISLLGLNILTGHNGQISLGHGAFYALGAYTAAILLSRSTGVPYWAVIPAAAIVGFVAGYLFGWPALRLEGLYLALATFALSVAVPQLLKHRYLEEWTGGVQGIALAKPEAPFGWSISPDQWLFIFALMVTAIVFWLAQNLLHSGSGRAMRAIRDQALAAEAVGINIKSVKATTFGVSAACTALGGALSALAVQFVAPDSFSMFLSITLLVGMVVGGVGTLWGSLIGAVFILLVPTVAEQISKSAPFAVYGIILILCVYAMPGGAMGWIERIRQRWT
jgi:branched-chain amino acid transport system permease protein